MNRTLNLCVNTLRQNTIIEKKDDHLLNVAKTLSYTI